MLLLNSTVILQSGSKAMKMLFDTLDASDLQVIRWPALDVQVPRAVTGLPYPSGDHWLFCHHTSPPRDVAWQL